MTQNQIAYQSLLEQKRSNLAREIETNRSNLANEVETHRANFAKEVETNRSNVARETETHRSNLENERLRRQLRDDQVWQFNVTTALNERNRSRQSVLDLLNIGSRLLKFSL